jgi:hypothetical protein
MTPSSYVLLNLHLHECLGEYPNALLEEIRVLIDDRLAQQLRESPILSSSAIVLVEFPR